MKTKIIATLGPTSRDEETIRRLVESGVSGFRINMVYGTLAEKEKIIRSIRKIEKDLQWNIPIIAEIKGRTLRIGEVPPSTLEAGEKLVFRLGDQRSDDGHIVPVPYDIPARIIKPDDKILLADGRIIVRVDNVIDQEIEGTVLEGGDLRSKARIAIRRKSLLNLPPITKEDEKAMEFLIRMGIDIIMIPDVLEPSDIDIVNAFLQSLGATDIKIFARIENPEALSHLPSIARKSDAIVFAKENIENMLVDEERPIADLFLEDLAVRATLKALRPIFVIVPTLRSLLQSPRIKRQDIIVISNLVTKFFDGFVLCSETAIGKNPVEVVNSIKSIIANLENKYASPKVDVDKNDPIYVKFNKGLLALAEMISAKIAIYTTKGRTALAIVRFRPKLDIFSFTDDKKTARYLNIIWGIVPILLKHAPNYEIMEEILVKKKLINKKDTVVFSYGWRPEAGSKQYLLIETID